VYIACTNKLFSENSIRLITSMEYEISGTCSMHVKEIRKTSGKKNGKKSTANPGRG
jgi:hypothetical protein